MTILYFGPITPQGQPSIGGYEAANRKNIDKLRELGMDVVEFPNPRINHKLGALGKLVYLKLMFTPFAMLKYAGRKDVVMHITPLHGYLITPSVWTLRVAKWLRIPTVMDMRAGGVVFHYKTKSPIVRWLIKKSLVLGDAVTVEGSEYISDIKNVMGIDKKAYYFPNLAICKNLLPTERDMKSWNIFYFGRITKGKGIDVMLEMMDELDENYHLYLAGGIANDIDKDELKRNDITYLGFMTPDELKEQMKRMHYFVFPTRWQGEGQSNSLIEAMSNGLVPLTANQGFCAEVVSDCGFVFPQGTHGKVYAEKIKAINQEQWKELSARCQEHIIKCHNIDIEIPKLINTYRMLINANGGGKQRLYLKAFKPCSFMYNMYNLFICIEPWQG